MPIYKDFEAQDKKLAAEADRLRKELEISFINQNYHGN